MGGHLGLFTSRRTMGDMCVAVTVGELSTEWEWVWVGQRLGPAPCRTQDAPQAHCLQRQKKGQPSYRTETFLFLLVCVP